MTLLEIAAKLNVSPSTVSRALNPQMAGLISEPVRRKIQAYAAKTGYVPNKTAQELVRGRSQTIGVILSTSFNSLFFSDHLAKVQAGIHAVMETGTPYACKWVVLPRGKSLSEADQHVLSSGIDGLLISTICDFTAYKLQDLAYALEKRWKHPIVALNLTSNSSSGINTVSFSNRDAAYKAVRHLIQRGHENIGLIYADNGSADARERVAGYKKALSDHHVHVNSAWVERGDFSPQSGYQAAIELFNRKNAGKISALFCINDEMAIGAIRALKALRKRCPQDVAVMGFDGLTAGEYVDPRLSTIAQPSFEIARAGTQLVLDLIDGKETGPTHRTLPAELMIRDSA